VANRKAIQTLEEAFFDAGREEDYTNPRHYREDKHDHEHWDVMQEWLGEDGWIGYMVGQTTKYLARWQFKGGVADLRKAATFLNKLITVVESKGEEHGER